MIQIAALLLFCQLVGTVASQVTGLPVPGPVIGLVLFLAALLLRQGLAETARPMAGGLLQHLALLFVPAGVGIIDLIPRFGGDGIAFLVAILVSTAAAICAGALTFRAVARLVGSADD